MCDKEGSTSQNRTGKQNKKLSVLSKNRKKTQTQNTSSLHTGRHHQLNWYCGYLQLLTNSPAYR